LIATLVRMLYRTIVALCALALLTAPTPTLAHVTKSDGDMKVMMHLDPDDEPLAGSSTKLHLLFRHAQQSFELSNCDCAVWIAPYKDLASIEATGTHIPLSEDMREASDSRVYATTTTFPTRGIYALVVEGTPREESAFKPFRVVFDTRVDQESSAVLKTPSTLPLPYGMLAAGLVLLA
jgi:hypothetical protein